MPRLLHQLATVGAFCVPVFFLLSAFLITESLERERASVSKICIQDFDVRRAPWIWPLYFAAFYGLPILERFVPHTGPRGAECVAAFTVFPGNVWICRHGWIGIGHR